MTIPDPKNPANSSTTPATPSASSTASAQSPTRRPASNGSYADVEMSGIYFIRSQKRYLRWSMIFPIYNLIVQIAYILFLPGRAPPGGFERLPPGPPVVFDIYTPAIVLIVFSLFAFVHYLFLRSWNSKVQKYDTQRGRFEELLKSSPDADDTAPEFVTYSQLFYDILNHMVKIRIIFIILNVTFVMSMGHFLQIFLIDLHLMIPTIPPSPPAIQVLDYVNQVGLIIYLIYQWKAFLRWNRKNTRIPAFEKQVYEEVFTPEDTNTKK